MSASRNVQDLWKTSMAFRITAGIAIAGILMLLF